jgi:hypothetical protein
MKCINVNQDVVVLNKDEFKKLVFGILKDYLNKWETYFEDYFEMLMDGYDISCVKVDIDGKVYELENEREFVKLVKEKFNDFEKLIEIAKKEF